MKLLAYAGALRLAASKLVCYLASVACGDGTCCGGEWHADDEEGECCNGQWLSDELCPEGQVYRRWGPEDACCGCLDATIFDSRVPGMVPVDDVLDVLCCGGSEYAEMPFDGGGGFRGCTSGCCNDGDCTNVPASDCTGGGGELLGQPCAAGQGCPIDCCSENSDGVVQCGPVGNLACVAPRVPADPDCASGCVGQCCIDGEPQGQMTQAACAAMDGLWQGLGSEDCSECSCRAPFTCDCCETKTSTAAGLVFYQPRYKRQPPWTGTFRVVATGHTESTILIHGETVGPNCNFEIEFVLCWESFNVEPVPCGTNFKRLDIKVCWFKEQTYTETLNFSACNTGLSVHLGDCEDSCVTTLVYDQGDSRVSNAHIYTRNNAELFVKSGTIEFTGEITAVAATAGGVPCANDPRVLKLTGGVAKISGIIKDLDGADRVEVHKDFHTASPNVYGGEWWLSGANEFTGRLLVHSGTVVIGADVAFSGPSPMGQGVSTSLLPLIGDTLLLADDVDVSRSLTIADDGANGATPVLGGYGTGSSSFTAAANIQLHADTEITLIAKTGGTVTFANSWYQHGAGVPTLSQAPLVTFGSTGNAGTVVINNTLSSLAYTVASGTLRLGGSDVLIDFASPVIISGSTLDLDTFSQTLEDLTLATGPATITGGTLNLGASGAASVTATGTGHEISSDVALGNAATLTINEFSALTISGVISGAHPITVEGDGTLTLSAANTYSGTTTINGGTAVAGDADAFGTGDIVVNTGGTLDTNGFSLPNTIVNSGGTVI